MMMMMMMSSTTKVKEMYHCIGCDRLLRKVTKRMESWLNEIGIECLVEVLSKDTSREDPGIIQKMTSIKEELKSYVMTAGCRVDVMAVLQGSKKISKSPFGDYRRKNGGQMQKCSRQVVQEQKLKLEPHLNSIVFRLPVDFCMTTLRTTSARQPYVKQ